MSSILVAFLVLAAFFSLYFVATLGKARSARSLAERERHWWQLLVGRSRRG